MKRISLILLAVVVSTAATDVCSAGYYYVPPQDRTRYSPYAFDYQHTGLIYGGVQYSPYAFQYGTSGLVYANVRYSPYAFSYRSSGLIADYAGILAPTYFGLGPWNCYDALPMSQPISPNRCTNQVRYREPAVTTQRQSCYSGKNVGVGKTADESAAEHQKDGQEVIRRYLHGKGISNYQTTQLLRIDDRTVSVDFVLNRGKLLIKYWDPEEIQALQTKPQYKTAVYQRYLADWQARARVFQQEGGTICYVTAANEKEIAAMLDQCKELTAG